MSKKISYGSKKLIVRSIRIDEADKCVKLQSTLTTREAKDFAVRTKEKYENLLKNGLMVGLYNGDELVGQIGTTLSTSRSPYIMSQNKIINKLFENSVVIEQGAYIIQKEYRGHGLQKQLELELLKRIKKLIKNQKLLAEKNKELAKILKEKKTVIVASGASSKNPASTLTSMHNKSMIVNSLDKFVANEGDEPITVYALMKIISPKAKILEAKNRNNKIEKKELLRERRKIVEISNNGKINPLPKKWVEKVMDLGYVIVKKNNKYGLKKPSSFLLTR